MKNINEIYKFVGEYLVSNIQSEDWIIDRRKQWMR